MDEIDEILKTFDSENKEKIIEVVSENNGNDNLSVASNKSYYKLPFHSNNRFNNNKDFTKFIKSVEKEVRMSDDYSHYLGYLKDELGLDKCAFLNNINNDMASIEFHHYPFTLWDICVIVTEKMLREGKKVTTFLVAKEVIECHYKHIIGLVPLSKTVHDLVHDGEIFVNLKMVFGRFNKFIDEYSPDQRFIKELNKLVQMSNNDTTYSEHDVLKKIEKR